MRKYLDAVVIQETKDMTREAWLEARGVGIGGSDASSVLGLSPFRSSISVYLEKVDYLNGIKPNISEVSEEAEFRMELGNKLEEFVAREFCLQTGKKVRNVNGILRNDKYPFAIANIDRAIVGEKAFLECKVTNSYGKKKWKKGVPIHYQIQLVHYMAVTGATHCYIAALIGNEELVIHRIDRDEEIINQVMELEGMFWDKCILSDNLPAPDGSEDYSKVLKGFYENSKDEEVILFEEDSLMETYDELCENLKDWETKKKTIEQYIQGQMKEHEVALIGDRRITWRGQSRSSLDTKRLKKDHPELIKEYMKTTTSRVFRV
ncbi:MAG: YqaJ viral recombinase family protein [Paraclostridium sp.]